MKKIVSWVFVIFLVSQAVVFADTWRKTTDDLYKESYDAQSEEQMEMNQSAAEVRARAYRALYAY